MKIALAFAAAVLLFTSAARADWQFTRWGMTPDQVVKASRGAAHNASSDETTANAPVGSSEQMLVIIPTYVTGDLQFIVDFYFDSDKKLTRVNLHLSSPDKGYEW